MPRVLHLENYLVVRNAYRQLPQSKSATLEVGSATTELEHTYQNLLAEANKNFFHREYGIALQNYKSLRYLIFTQSHPEMPSPPGGHGVIDFPHTKADINRLFEMGRRMYATAAPGDLILPPLNSDPVINPGEFPVVSGIEPFVSLGVNAPPATLKDFSSQRKAARDKLLNKEFPAAEKLYNDAADAALKAGQNRTAAEILTEAGGMLATYSADADRPRALKAAATTFNRADTLYRQLGDQEARSVVSKNLSAVNDEIRGAAPQAAPVTALQPALQPNLGAINLNPVFSTGRINPGLSRSVSIAATNGAVAAASRIPSDNLVRFNQLPETKTTAIYMVPAEAAFVPAPSLLVDSAVLRAADRRVGVYTNQGIKPISVDRQQFANNLLAQIYQPRVAATALEALKFYEEIETNFVAYIPHLYFFILPVALGDTYLALGQYDKALEEYRNALNYAFLNRGIEAPYLWLKMAQVVMRRGDELFRREQPALARQQYEQIIALNLDVPAASPLYAPAQFVTMRTMVGEVARRLRGQPSGDINPRVGQLVTAAYSQLQKIQAGLNFLGLSANHFPIFRFKYLQSAANYLADSAIQTERTFINFRAAAENQKMERIQLENAVKVNQAMLQAEQKRLDDAALEREYAQRARQYAQMRAQHAQDNLNDWNTTGWDLMTINAALAWASNASNDQDITYTGVHYRGKSHDFDTDVEEFYDVVGEWREELNWEIQRNRLQRQRDEMQAEVGLAQVREQQASIRFDIQKLAVEAARWRLEGAEEMLDYATDRMFDEDLWFRLAAELQDLSRDYLDMAIYAAFLMERAYEVEFDRDLNRIRLDYGIGGVEGLLGGDYLKRDIAAFTNDYLENAQKKNPVRLAISLREEYPLAFRSFTQTGVLPFRTDLEIFDRRYPGTYQRKIKKLEIFVEGLIPAEGVHGTLLHQGLSSEWKLGTNNVWGKQARTVPPERMVLSSYQFRRDIAVFQPSQEMLDLFENLGPQGNWRLEIPASCNNLDYAAISDIKFVVYFDAAHAESLVQHQKTFYSNEGGRSLVLSSRFHFPDEFFRLDAEREVTFELHPARFAYNYSNLRMRGFGVRLVPKAGQTMANQPISVIRTSDNSTVNGSTSAKGVLQSNQATMAPFAAWRDKSPVDSFRVVFGQSVNLAALDDVELFVDYVFSYRADPNVAA